MRVIRRRPRVGWREQTGHPFHAAAGAPAAGVDPRAGMGPWLVALPRDRAAPPRGANQSRTVLPTVDSKPAPGAGTPDLRAHRPVLARSQLDLACRSGSHA